MSYVRSFWHLCLHLGKPQYFEGFPASDSFGQSILEHLPSLAFFFNRSRRHGFYHVSIQCFHHWRTSQALSRAKDAGRSKGVRCGMDGKDGQTQENLEKWWGDFMIFLHIYVKWRPQMTYYTQVCVRIDLNVWRKSRSFKIQSAYWEDTLW